MHFKKFPKCDADQCRERHRALFLSYRGLIFEIR